MEAKSSRPIKYFIGFGKISAKLPVKASCLVEIRLHLSSIPNVHAIPIRIATCPFFLRSLSLRFTFLLQHASIGGLNRIREDIRSELRRETRPWISADRFLLSFFDIVWSLVGWKNILW
jgi:hypothetical protein